MHVSNIYCTPRCSKYSAGIIKTSVIQVIEINQAKVMAKLTRIVFLLLLFCHAKEVQSQELQEQYCKCKNQSESLIINHYCSVQVMLECRIKVAINIVA